MVPPSFTAHLSMYSLRQSEKYSLSAHVNGCRPAIPIADQRFKTAAQRRVGTRDYDGDFSNYTALWT
ncbi:hypothetical protein [Paenibacillus motobuensis]|uniref:hypothetical protein n=1 Tax=Paenibacillus motobuensis TaxID=295324 RepID=UPI0031E236AA